MKNKPPSKKCKSAKKTIKGKIEPICVSVNLYNYNTSKIYNRNLQANRQEMECKECKPVPPRPRPPKPPKPPRPNCHECNPRRGELVINGGFENQPDQFLGWIINAGVSPIKPQFGDVPHQGYSAVRLGTDHTRGLIYQDVPGICPGLFYQLNFFLSAATECGNESVFVMLEFLDHHKNRLDEPALEIFVPRDSLSNEGYSFFINVTHIPSPPESRFARISFITECAKHAGRAVHLDDVSLIAI